MSLYLLAKKEDVEDICDLALNSHSKAVRRRATEIAGHEFVDDHEGLVRDVLCRVARHDSNEYVRATAVDGIEQIGDDALREFVGEDPCRGLDSDVPEYRMASASAIGQQGDGAMTGDLVARLDDPDRRVRERICYALARIGDSRAVPYLVDRLDECEGVRKAAAEALATIGTPEAVEALTDRLTDSNVTIRRIAAGSLGISGEVTSVAPLAAALTDDHKAVRESALYSLIDLLSNASRDRSHEIREKVMNELEQADPNRIEHHLLHVLQETSSTLRKRNTIWILGRLTADFPDPRIIDELAQSLSSDDHYTAQFAATSLTLIDNYYTEAALCRVLVDPDEPVDARRRAAFALRTVGAERALDRVERIIDREIRVPTEVRKEAYNTASALRGQHIDL